MTNPSQLPYITYFDYLNFNLSNPTDELIKFRLFGKNYPLPAFEQITEEVIEAPVESEQTTSGIPAAEWNRIAEIGREGVRFATIIYNPERDLICGLAYGFAAGTLDESYSFEMDLQGNIIRKQDTTYQSYSGKIAVSDGVLYLERNPAGSSWSKIDFDAGIEEEVASPPEGASENRLYTFREVKSSSHEYYDAVVNPPNNSEIVTTTAEGESSKFNTRSFITGFTQDGEKNIYVCSFDYIYVLKYPEVGASEEEEEPPTTRVVTRVDRHFFGSGQLHCMKLVSSSKEQLSQPITYVDHSMSEVQTKTVYPMQYFSASCHAQPIVDTCFCYEDQLLVDEDRYLEWELLPQTNVQLRFFVKKVRSVIERKL